MNIQCKKSGIKKIGLMAFCSLLVMGCANKNVSSENDAKEQMTGAYTHSRKVSKEELNLFRETYKGETDLTPVSVSTQVVAGTNYMFICKDRQGNKYRVVIYEKLPCYGGQAEVTSTEKIED